MTTKQCLLYAKIAGFKTIADAWSHAVFILSYPKYYPKDYKSKNSNSAKNWAIELEELFEDFKKKGFIYLNEKKNWCFKDLNIEEGLNIVSYIMT